MSSLFSCVNCRLDYAEQQQYKQHYKSEHHRYNVKRRLIGLMPLSQQEYNLQFQNQCSSKSSTQKQLHCELCSKKFLSPQTYKQHLNSQKHKNNRKKLMNTATNKLPSEFNHIDDERSQISSCSQFSVLTDKKDKKNQCLFCSTHYSKQHMLSYHNFPPFADQCTNIEELTEFVRKQIQEGKCLICEQKFQCEQSTKQHMIDCGHCKLNINEFGKYEKFYLWKIQESDEEETEMNDLEKRKQNKENDELDESHDFEDMKKQTLQTLEIKRQERIQMTNIGYRINGQQVGARCLKQYYKQYLSRDIPQNPLKQQNALTNGDDWKNSYKKKKKLMPCRYEKIQTPIIAHR